MGRFIRAKIQHPMKSQLLLTGIFFFSIVQLSAQQSLITFKSCNPIEICNYSPSCRKEQVVFDQLATTTCGVANPITYAYYLDLNSNQTFDITGNSNQFIADVPHGKHSLIWIAKDGCGDSAQCKVDVIIKDCVKPTPVVVGLNGKTMPNNCTLVIWATDWEKSSYDNCTPHEKLEICVIKGNDVNGIYPEIPDADLCKVNATFDGNETGTQSVGIFIRDTSGNWDHAVTYVVIDGGDCDGDPNLENLNGNLGLLNASNKCGFYLNYQTYPKDLVWPNSDTTIFYICDGFFNINAPFEKADSVAYTLDGSAAQNSPINTYDLVLIQKHLLNIKKFKSNWEYIAADANESNSITVADIIELRKAILKISFPTYLKKKYKFFHKFKYDSIKFNNSFPKFDKNISSFVTPVGVNYPVSFYGIQIGNMDGN